MDFYTNRYLLGERCTGRERARVEVNYAAIS